MSTSPLPICTACGTQYSSPPPHHPSPPSCKICLDPRQFVPPTGQTWTTLNELRKTHKNSFEQDKVDARIWSIYTTPKFAIGQRAILLLTPHGNILWDLISLLDEETVRFINEKGGLKAIVVSHPHYYGTYVEWARVFGCEVLVSGEDGGWLCRMPPPAEEGGMGRGGLRFLEGEVGSGGRVVEGVTAIKMGGHFRGSLVLHWEGRLFIADTIVTVPSAYTPHPRPPGQTSYSFQWSIPNMIPLPPDDIMRIWRAIKPFKFHTTHGAFVDMDVRDKGLKARMLESMKIQVRGEGWENHEILEEVVDDV